MSHFRSVGSVSRKTADLFTALPHYGGRSTKGGRTDRMVLADFLRDPEGMALEAAHLRARIAERFIATPTGPENRSIAEPWEGGHRRQPHPQVLPVSVPVVGPAEHAPAERVVASRTFEVQLAKAGRRGPAVEVVRDTVAVLLSLGGRASLAQVAAGTGLPLAPLASSTATVFKRVLNVEGYPVLEVADGFYRLNQQLLEQQFLN